MLMSDSRAEVIRYPPQGYHHSQTATAIIPAASLDSAAMRFLAITLVLAIFAGSPSSVFSEEQESRLEQLKQKLKECWQSSPHPFRCLPNLVYANSEFLQNVTSHFSHHQDLLSQSDVIQAVKGQTYESFANISKRFSALGRTMPSEVKEVVEMTLVIPTGLMAKFFTILQDFSKKMEPATRDLYHALEPVMGPHAHKALERVRPYASVARARAQQMGRNQTERLKQRLQELENMAPQIHAVLQHLEEFQVALQPLGDELQEIVRQRMDSAASVARPYVKPILDQAKEYATELKKWAPSPVFASDEH